MGYTASLTIETYVIRRADEPGALATSGWTSDGIFNMNTAGEFDFVIADVNNLTILFTALGCKLSTESAQFPSRGLNTKSTTWRTSRIENMSLYTAMCDRKLCEFRETPNVKTRAILSQVSEMGKVQRLFRKEVDYKYNRSAEQPVMVDDIVYSNKKLLAA